MEGKLDGWHKWMEGKDDWKAYVCNRKANDMERQWWVEGKGGCMEDEGERGPRWL